VPQELLRKAAGWLGHRELILPLSALTGSSYCVDSVARVSAVSSTSGADIMEPLLLSLNPKWSDIPITAAIDCYVLGRHPGCVVSE
jgi:hypothetical protein